MSVKKQKHSRLLYQSIALRVQLPANNTHPCWCARSISPAIASPLPWSTADPSFAHFNSAQYAPCSSVECEPVRRHQHIAARARQNAAPAAMGLLTIIKKVKRKEKEMRLLMV